MLYQTLGKISLVALKSNEISEQDIEDLTNYIIDIVPKLLKDTADLASRINSELKNYYPGMSLIKIDITPHLNRSKKLT